MDVIINLDIEVGIPFCNSGRKENLSFGRELVISFNMLLQHHADWDPKSVRFPDLTTKAKLF